MSGKADQRRYRQVAKEGKLDKRFLGGGRVINLWVDFRDSAPGGSGLPSTWRA